MRRAGLAFAAAIMATGTLTACGGGDDFCDVGGDLTSSDFTEGSDEAKNALDDAVDAAPDEIKGDLETLRDGYEAAMAAKDDPEAASDIDMDALSEANSNVSDYVSENCN